MIKYILPLLVLSLVGCADAPAPVQIKLKYIYPKIVPECLSAEPNWVSPDPKQDETRSQAAWRDHENHGSFQSLANDHATCKAALAAQSKGKKNG